MNDKERCKAVSKKFNNQRLPIPTCTCTDNPVSILLNSGWKFPQLYTNKVAASYFLETEYAYSIFRFYQVWIGKKKLQKSKLFTYIDDMYIKILVPIIEKLEETKYVEDKLESVGESMKSEKNDIQYKELKKMYDDLQQKTW